MINGKDLKDRGLQQHAKACGEDWHNESVKDFLVIGVYLWFVLSVMGFTVAGWLLGW